MLLAWQLPGSTPELSLIHISVAKAEYQAQIDRAQQTAAQAGPLAQAKAQQDVLSEQAKVAQAQAELRRQQLVAEVVRPAEALSLIHI